MMKSYVPSASLQKVALLYEFFGSALMVYAFSLNSIELRGAAYLIGWLLAYHISGAEFNAATSIAAFFVKKDWS